jgi:radical SAM protein with 4Fe4S-binding SPASM domain
MYSAMTAPFTLTTPDLPYALQVEITSNCNLRCKMCPLSTTGTLSSITPGHMQDVLWQEILPLARKVGQVMIAGFGEPLVHKGCLPLLRELDAEGIAVSIVTNGMAITPRTAAELAAIKSLFHINVSIDSPDPEAYRTIRGADVGKALGGLRNLMAAIDNPERVSVSSVVTADNIATLPAFPPLLAELGVRYYVLQELINYVDETSDIDPLQLIDYPAVIEQIRACCAETGVSFQSTIPERLHLALHDNERLHDSFYDDSYAQVDQARQCNLAWEIPYVDKDGLVYPCCYAASQSAEVLGDLKQESLEAIWTGKAYAGFRSAILDGRHTPEICRTCTAVPLGPHNLRLYSAEVLPERSQLSGPGERRLVVRNTGTRAWRREDMVRVGTANPRDHTSPLYHQSWLAANRVTTHMEDRVPPGGTATFQFAARSAEASDTFQLVVEGVCWIPNTRFKAQ